MVERRKDEDIERFIKRFKYECDKIGIIKEVREREFFVSPSEKRHKQKVNLKRKFKLQKIRDEKGGVCK